LTLCWLRNWETRVKFIQVCGYQRSGTSFLSKVLNSHPDIYISGELPRNMYGPSVSFLKKLVEDFDRIGGSERKSWQLKKRQFNLDLFLSASKYDEDCKGARSAAIFGNKTPRAERYYKFLLAAMRDMDPVFIYCLRDPDKTLESKMNMFRTSRNFSYSLKDYENSIKDLLEMRRVVPDRVYVFSIENYNNDKEAELNKLLRFVGARFSADVVDLLKAVPPRNTTSDQLKSRERHEGVSFDKQLLTDDMKAKIERSSLCSIAKELLESGS